jgi:hypothetical protein
MVVIYVFFSFELVGLQRPATPPQAAGSSVASNIDRHYRHFLAESV